MKFRYHTDGEWFKGNTHIHSSASDGGKTFAELAELYAAAGYDFLCRTDHWVPSDAAGDSSCYPLLWIDGIELDGRDEAGNLYHVVCLGKIEGICREDGFVSGLRSAREQGALTILAHPHWCGNAQNACLCLECDGVEVYNHVCHWLNGKSSGGVHWDAALMHDPQTLAFAADDAHIRKEHPGWNGGWVVVNAEQCTPEAILSAIWQGNFYSSCGPELYGISLEGDHLQIETSPVRYARLVGPGPAGARESCEDGAGLETIRFPLPHQWRYAYLEIEDMEGRRAWTNSLFVNDGSACEAMPCNA